MIHLVVEQIWILVYVCMHGSLWMLTRFDHPGDLLRIEIGEKKHAQMDHLIKLLKILLVREPLLSLRRALWHTITFVWILKERTALEKVSAVCRRQISRSLTTFSPTLISPVQFVGKRAAHKGQIRANELFKKKVIWSFYCWVNLKKKKSVVTPPLTKPINPLNQYLPGCFNGIHSVEELIYLIYCVLLVLRNTYAV